MPTIIGLAGARLTAVLKDFSVAFFGRFVLMGRNGIRLGDWVEIKGVARSSRSACWESPSKAITLIFSTAGQWLWDELQVTLPAGGEPYRVAEEIRQTVDRETEPDANQAEEDWKRVTHQYGMRPFSAHPAVDLTAGRQRAPQRYEVKSRLFQAIVEFAA
jgi:hypothetical protein